MHVPFAPHTAVVQSESSSHAPSGAICGLQILPPVALSPASSHRPVVHCSSSEQA